MWPFNRKKLPLYRIFKNEEGYVSAILMGDNKTYHYICVEGDTYYLHNCVAHYMIKPTLEEAEQVFRDYAIAHLNTELKRMAKEFHVIKEIW